MMQLVKYFTQPGKELLCERHFLERHETQTLTTSSIRDLTTDQSTTKVQLGDPISFIGLLTGIGVKGYVQEWK